MKKAIYRSFVELTANKANSYLLRKFTASPISKTFVKSFAKTYKLNEKEMEKPLKEYHNLQELFTRRLKKGSRTIDERLFHITSPVDGILASAGKVTENKSFVIKGQEYSLDEMLGNKSEGKKYSNGYFLIFYLSPRHYHRIHSPISGQIVKQWALGSKSYPVNEQGLKYGKRPLSRNYRLITEINKGNKHMAMVKVGALNVNSIHTVHVTNTIEKGEEIAYFTFGSTVVLLFEENMFTLNSELIIPTEIEVGKSIGTLRDEKEDV